MKRALPALALFLAACSGTPTKSTPPTDAPASARASQPAGASPSSKRGSPYAPAQEDLSKRGDYVAGGLYAPHVKDLSLIHI